VKPHVLVCTTFRSFDGSPNEPIQRAFLTGLAAQAYRSWELVVTTFGEAGVKEALHSSGVAHIVVPGMRGDYRFSLSEVLANGVARAEATPGPSVVLWTTCDVVFPPSFLQVVARRFAPGISGTSHPHRLAQSYEDYKAGRIEKTFPFGPFSRSAQMEGIDFVYFDADIFRPKGPARTDLGTYRFVDWGLFEHFLAGMARLYAHQRLNLWASAPVVKIVNTRDVVTETDAYFESAWQRNYEPMRRFLDDYGLGDDLLTIQGCHEQFGLVRRPTYVRRIATYRARAFVRGRLARHG
jgi:hypothetical protein